MHQSTINPNHPAQGPQAASRLFVNGKVVHLQEVNPSTSEILEAAGLSPVTKYVVVYRHGQGPTTEIGLDEQLDLCAGTPTEIYACESDRLFYFTLDEQRYAWAAPLDVQTLRKLADIPSSMSVVLKHKHRGDEELSSEAIIELADAGIERLFTRPRIWKLNVQGVVIESVTPAIEVRQALIQAGFDPNQGWIIILKVAGQPKKQVELTDEIDLTNPGIERLRLTPKQINNGDSQPNIRRDFQLLPKDELFLGQIGAVWQTFDEGRRWLLISSYTLPPGFTQTNCDIAIEIPSTYPMAQLDMFYCHPHLALTSGSGIPQTEYREQIGGLTYQRWSRHRPDNCWSPEHDSIASHMGLIEESLAREVGQ